MLLRRFEQLALPLLLLEGRALAATDATTPDATTADATPADATPADATTTDDALALDPEPAENPPESELPYRPWVARTGAGRIEEAAVGLSARPERAEAPAALSAHDALLPLAHTASSGPISISAPVPWGGFAKLRVFWL